MPKSSPAKRPSSAAPVAAFGPPSPASARRSASANAPLRQVGWLIVIGAFTLSLFLVAAWFPAALGAAGGAIGAIPLILGAFWETLLATLAASFGVAPPVIILLGVPFAYWLNRREWSGAEKFRWWTAGLLTSVAVFALLGQIRPDGVTLARVPLREVSAGGLLGRLAAGDAWWEGPIRLIALGLAIAALTAPSGSASLGRWLATRAGLAIRRTARAGAGQMRRGAGHAAATIAARRAGRSDRVPETLDLGLDDDTQLDPDDTQPRPVGPETLSDLLLPLDGPVVDRPNPPAKPPRKPAAPVATLAARSGPSPKLPPLDLLDEAPPTELNRSDIQQRVSLIEETLAAYGVSAKVVQVAEGPTVTQFGVEPGWDIKYREVKEREADGRVKLDKDGKPKVRLEEIARTRVKVNRVTALANDLALALAAPTIRIEAPVPGKPIIGIEVPNRTYSLVTLRSVIESAAFQRIAAKSKLPLALGQNVAGEPVAADLAKMPHLLIAGSTGSGKSVCLNTIIASILMQATPADVRMLMIDPKRVEMVPYNGIPHLLSPVITEAEKVVGVLGWVVKDMDQRYRMFEEAGARNIEAYNRKMIERRLPTLPYEVVIIDELADLMMVAADEVERQICRLAQLARATGIHLIVATQRPSVDVLTGLIKANFPTRISFAVSSQVDSRTILDTVGAEKLLGRGDMLFLPPDAAKPSRVQGNYVSDREIDAIVEFWKAAAPPQYLPEIEEAANRASGDEPDALFEEAKRLVEQHPRISVSFLQRKLRIGYNRAARLMDQLEEAGLIEDGNSLSGEDF
ncbi:MAG TPA: DNA translocase FtsK [Dehalococcoidia bacterium]|nr:DNA translocase FtsK [Dehalococcoidia bacterium]